MPYFLQVLTSTVIPEIRPCGGTELTESLNTMWRHSKLTSFQVLLHMQTHVLVVHAPKKEIKTFTGVRPQDKMKCKILGKDVLDGFLNQASDSVTLISVTTDVEQCSITEEWRYYDSSECVIKYRACD